MSRFVPAWVADCVKALSTNYWLIFPATTLLIASFLCYKTLGSHHKAQRATPSSNATSKSPSGFSFSRMHNYFQHQPPIVQTIDPMPSTRPLDLNEKHRLVEDTTRRVKQPYDVFLVLDVEATCLEGAGFHWPNEICEWPVCLMRWKDKSPNSGGRASKLEVVDEFRSFVKPSWAPILSPFCTQLTGITQAQVDNAPLFPTVLATFSKFLIKNGLIDPVTGSRLVRFCWCTDGPFDVQNFVVKQCFISNIPMPEWLRGDVIDVRKEVVFWSEGQPSGFRRTPRPKPGERRKSMGITLQLEALGLDPFEGRQHCGIDDTRNIARILAELARRGVCLEPNCVIDPRRRWHWMGKKGEILEYTLAYPDQ